MSNLNCTECDGEVMEVVIIEEWVKIKIPIPIGKKYQFRIDKGLYETHKSELTLDEILSFAGKTADRFRLYEHIKQQQPREVLPGVKVDLRTCGVERFSTMPKDTTEGRGLRFDFQLPGEDAAYLEGRAFDWEALRFNANYIVIRGWKLPIGYTVQTVDIAIMIPPSYPEAALDMFWVSPAIARVDGKPIGGLNNEDLGGASWQRWSRHRSSQNPWRPGLDDLASHLSLVDGELTAELQKR